MAVEVYNVFRHLNEKILLTNLVCLIERYRRTTKVTDRT